MTDGVEVHHLLLDTKSIANMRIVSPTHIEYDVDLVGSGSQGLSGFDYGLIKWITKAELRWLRFESWSQLYSDIPYVSIYIDEIGDQIISNNSIHNRSTFIVPIKNEDLIYMTDAMANSIEFTEPIQSLSKFTVVMKAGASLLDATNTNVHSMLLTFYTQRKQLY